ncbi:hypothetical protein K466DRAFT_125824 [Polyporus arcularius HHB13444]|uniref:SWIM-type domain-containing protein n=1 Tax=Polyporus arcularius HHB13444 TaxID=1314778 RepID=A0A5C3PBQ4_9APHY|nr:hypothetical protein K466DRAFT_125824 [Polyporus arcularius HHB13444]
MPLSLSHDKPGPLVQPWLSPFMRKQSTRSSPMPFAWTTYLAESPSSVIPMCSVLGAYTYPHVALIRLSYPDFVSCSCPRPNIICLPCSHVWPLRSRARDMIALAQAYRRRGAYRVGSRQ